MIEIRIDLFIYLFLFLLSHTYPNYVNYFRVPSLEIGKWKTNNVNNIKIKLLYYE